jgi:hypothetical protein
VSGSYNYLPIGGERDIQGFLRQDDRLTPNIGFGSRPFFDIGAFEFRELFPPHVTNVGAPDLDADGIADGVTATVFDPATGGPRPINIYRIGGLAGANVPPQTIQIRFDKRLDPNTINRNTVLLQASGGDGIFGNANSSLDRFIDLSGKLDFDPVTRTLTINLANTGLVLTNDVFRIRVRGSGGDVVRDPEGNALDGENLDPAGQQRPLPSGDGFPGGDFVLTFTIDASAPTLSPASFRLAPASDTNVVGDRITRNALPSFTGTVLDIFPPAMPQLGQTVILDISTRGDGVFDRPDAGRATTDAQGNFTVTVAGPPLPDSPYNVGPDGLLGTADDVFATYSLARVRSSTRPATCPTRTTPPPSCGSWSTPGPRRSPPVSPAPGTEAATAGGQVTISFTVDENLDPTRLTAATLQVIRGRRRRRLRQRQRRGRADHPGPRHPDPAAGDPRRGRADHLRHPARRPGQRRLPGLHRRCRRRGDHRHRRQPPGRGDQRRLRLRHLRADAVPGPLRRRLQHQPRPGRDQRQPVPDDHRRPGGGADRRHRGREAGNLHREHRPAVARAARLGHPGEQRIPRPAGQPPADDHPRPVDPGRPGLHRPGRQPWGAPPASTPRSPASRSPPP